MKRILLAILALLFTTGCPPKLGTRTPDAHARVEPPAPGVVAAYTAPPSP